jgi:hypothetical protein
MQIAIRRVLPAARQRLARPQRFGPPAPARVRLAAQTRCLSHTLAFLQSVDDNSIPKEGAEAITGDAVGSNTPVVENKEGAAAAPAGKPSVAEGEPTFAPEVPHEEMVNSILEATGGGEAPEDRPPARRGRPAGAKTRTTTRKAAPIPKPVLPEWFIERGVLLREENQPGPRASSVGIYWEPPETGVLPSSEGRAPMTVGSALPVESTPETAANTKSSSVESPVPEESATEAATSESKSSPETNASEREPTSNVRERYYIHQSVWNEITAYVRTGLLLPKAPFADGLAATKAHCLLHSPKDGGLYYLDAIAEKLAAEVGADLVRIDTQDVAEIAGDFLGDSRHGE